MLVETDHAGAGTGTVTSIFSGKLATDSLDEPVLSLQPSNPGARTLASPKPTNHDETQPRSLLSPISANVLNVRARTRQKVASVVDLAVDMRENFHIGAVSLFKPNYQDEPQPTEQQTGCVPCKHFGSYHSQAPAKLGSQPSLPPPSYLEAPLASRQSTETDDEPTPRDSEKRPIPARSQSIRRKPVPSLQFGPALPARPSATFGATTIGYERVSSAANGSPFGKDASPDHTYKTHRSSFDIRLHNQPEQLAGLCWPPPAKVRRTQSMFATPEQLLHEQIGDGSQGSYLEDPSLYISKRIREVPTFTVRQDPFRRITHDTLCALLDGSYAHVFDTVRVIDCRFEYEYEGGHISGAVNISSKPKLESTLLNDAPTDSRSLLVFHCEYSAYRGPIMAAHLRRCDRQRNYKTYPQLSYPDIVILDGGYSGFFEQHMNRCQPQNYVEMNDNSHQTSRERELSRFRSHLRPRSRHRKTASQSSELGRAFTFPERPFASFAIPSEQNDSSSPRRAARSASII